MLKRAEHLLAGEPEDVKSRVTLVQASGETVLSILDAEGFAAVLCHGVLLYLDDPCPMVETLAQLARGGGVVSIVTKNARSMAVRPALSGDWKAALLAFDAERQVNGLGLDSRGDTVEDLGELLTSADVEPVAWYGVRLFTDGWTSDRGVDDPEEEVLAVELEASARDPYRQLSRLIHVVGVRRPTDSDSSSLTP